MEFRWHPILEGLKINEDGTEIIYNDVPVDIREYQTKTQRHPYRAVNMHKRTFTVRRLVCEAWHGVPPTREHAAKRIDFFKDDHYTNLYWGKKGSTKQLAPYNRGNHFTKVSKETYLEMCKAIKKQTLKKTLKEFEVSYYSWAKAKEIYGK